jgi:hypothetical protein
LVLTALLAVYVGVQSLIVGFVVWSLLLLLLLLLLGT